jgi:hypothetical protein
MFKFFAEDMTNDLRRTLSHHNEEPWQTNDKKRLDKRVNDVLPKVMYCLQPAVRSSISSFALDGDGNLTDTILKSIYDGICLVFPITTRPVISCILARKKVIDQRDNKGRREIDDYIKRNSDSNYQKEETEQRLRIDGNVKRTTNSNHQSGKKEKMNREVDEKHRAQRMELNKQMLNLALEWNSLEVVKDLVVRGSIENITVSTQFSVEDGPIISL